MNATESLRCDGIPQAGARPRRGVLLLVVLSMLTLFMMLGVAYVIMASRARESSRAFSRAQSQERLAERGDRHLLDRAKLLLIRGVDPAAMANRQPGELKKADGAPVTTMPFSFESLLDDMYGSDEALVAYTAGVFGSSGPMCQVDLQKLGLLDPSGNGKLPVSPIELAGRIVSFVRESGRITSHRILRAESISKGRYRVFLANHGDVFRPSRPPIAGSPAFDFPPDGTKVVINGRAHSGTLSATNESWDGFDFQDSGGNPTNPFLTHLEPDPSIPSSSLVKRFAMFDGPGASSPVSANVDRNDDEIPDYCDNDGDGVLDGQFFDPGFGPIPIEKGVELRVDLSCLIVDLDGRINVNAHGCLASMLYPPQSANWPVPAGGVAPFDRLPPGSGYGPAEINAQVAFDELMSARGFSSADDPRLSIFGGAVSGEQYAASAGPTPDKDCRTLPPGLGPLEGRYGEVSRADTIDPMNGDTLANYSGSFQSLPGLVGTNDNGVEEQRFVDQATGAPINRPIDLHGYGKHRIVPSSGAGGAGGPTGVVPTMEFVQPERIDALLDDPYELDLVTVVAGGRNANPRTDGRAYDPAPRDNRFSIAELERVLRPYDSDTYRLQQRLFTLLGSQAEASRFLVTSESWSIPAITGEAARLLFGPDGWYAKVGDPSLLFGDPSSLAMYGIPDGLVPADVAAGLKLDVSPVLHTDLQRRAFFKDLYLLSVAVATPAGENPSPPMAARLAQWAANVVEFQDADSTMTQYEYDPEPLDGWGVDGDPETEGSEPTRATVWGGERPDVIITQGLAWENSDTNEGELYVVLHRPLKSTLLTPDDDPANPAPAEPIDPNLSGPRPDQVDLGRLTAANDPVWRLSIGSGAAAKTIRFDEKFQNEPQDSNGLGSTDTDPNAPARTFGPHQWLCIMPSGGGTTVSIAPELEKFMIDIGSLRAEPGATEVEVRLERLADPSKKFESDEDSPEYNPYLVVDGMTMPRVVNRRVDPQDANTPLPFEKFTRLGWNSRNPSPVQGDPIQMTAEWLGEPEWFPWPDRPLIGITELFLVPGFAPNTYRPLPEDDRKAVGLFDGYQPPAGMSFLPDPKLLEVVRVPSRYRNARLSFGSTPDTETGLATIGVSTAIRPTHQIDIGREPGLVNLNTISSDAAWKAVVQGAVLRNEQEANVGVAPKVPGRAPDSGQPIGGGASTNPADFASSPAKTVVDLLSLKASPSPAPPYEDSSDDVADADTNPWHRLGTATRVSNVATNRSHVFGIWITVRTMEFIQSQPDPDTARYSRMFVIYDRSKPVAFEPGKDHNVADGILLERVLP